MRAYGEWLNREALPFLGAAAAVSVVIAFPIEQFVHSFHGAGSYWELHSCNAARLGLDLGNILQAILTPLLVFLLPGPGSILLTKSTRQSSPRRPGAIAQARQSAPGAPNTRTRSLAIRAFAVVLLIVCLWVFLSYFLFVKYWFIDHPEMQPPPKPSALPTAIVGIVISLLGMGWAACLLRLPWASFRFIAVGWLVAGGIAILWWYGLSRYAQLHGMCTDLFDLARPISPSSIDTPSDCAHYYIIASMFTALWAGITAGGLRLQSERAAKGFLTDALGRYQSFYWAGLLGWAIQYRLCMWLLTSLTFLISSHRSNQEWVAGSFMAFFFVTASSFWSIGLVRVLWNLGPASRRTVVFVAFMGSFVVYFLTAFVSLWSFWFAGGAFLIPLTTLNVCGLAWAFFLGKWYWRTRQPQGETSLSAMS